MYAYDRKNHIFASLKFGQIEDGLFSSSREPQDYFHGSIFNVTPEFETVFDKTTTKPEPSEKQILKRLAAFDGIWNSYVRVDN